jgi:hypothetical protein
MLAHLPGRMSQPSRKGVTSNIFILRCSFHKTAKRLSITGLTHLLRLRSKIQSSIVRHNNWPSQLNLWFCYNKNGKRNTKYHENFKTNTELSKFTDNTRPSNDDKTQKSRIGLLHRNQFPEAIQLTWTIISQIYRKKKDLPTSTNDTKYLSLIFVIKQQWKVEVA